MVIHTSVHCTLVEHYDYSAAAIVTLYKCTISVCTKKEWRAHITQCIRKEWAEHNVVSRSKVGRNDQPAGSCGVTVDGFYQLSSTILDLV